MPTAYLALDDRVVAATGPDWRPTVTLEGRDIESVTATGKRVHVGTFESGVWRSDDGGDTVTQTWPSDAPEAVTALATDPHDSETVWAGTEPSRVYRSGDGGRTWTERPGLTDLPSASSWSFPPRPSTHHVHWIEPDPHSTGRLYVGIEAGGFVRTDDGGSTWRDRPEGARVDNHQIATHPHAPGRVYSAAGDGYAESEDGGDTWTYPQSGLDHRYVWSVVVHPEDPDHVLVSAASGAYRAHSTGGETYVYARRGGDWDLAMDGLPGPEGVARPILAVGPDGAAYALSNHGLFRAPEWNEWERLDVPWRENYREQVPKGLAVV